MEKNQAKAGFYYALFAYLIWVCLLFFWKALDNVNPLEVSIHRLVWAMPFAGLVLLILGRTGDIIPTLKSPKRVSVLFCTSVLISINWLVFIWAVAVERALETALAYYINPLLSVAMGAVFLGEKFNKLQLCSIAIAALAVLMLTLLGGNFPWVSLLLAATFALYGLLRKTVNVGPTQGFFVETLLLFPFAAGYLIWLVETGQSTFLYTTAKMNFMLVMAGVFTAIPLILYANGAKRLRLSTLGMMQYIVPTMIFLISIFVFKEPMNFWLWIAFIMIWMALVIYTYSLFSKKI